MKPYPKYKDSGVEWIGEIPEHWEVKKLKHLCEVVLGKMLTSDDKGGLTLKPYLRSANIQWGNVDISDVKEMWFSSDELMSLRVKKGDLLVSEGGEVGRAAIWQDELPECYIQNSVHKLSVKKGNNAKYFLYSFIGNGQRGVFDSLVNRISLAHLTVEKIREIPFAVAPEREQILIERFLDKKIGKLDSIINTKQKLIELLKEERIGIINHAVTKGINPKAKMKDSGVEWIGEIPEHWEVKKLKYVLASILGGGTPSTSNSQFWNGAIPWVSPKDMKVEKYLDSTIDYVTEDAIKNSSTSLISEESILVVVRSGILKHSLPLAINSVPVTLNQDMKALIPNSKLSNDYLFWMLKGFSGLILTHCNKIGATVDSIEMEDLLRFYVSFPSKNEQDQIVANIETETSKIDLAITHIEKEIELLQEYRTALISEVVTGKLRVI